GGGGGGRGGGGGWTRGRGRRRGSRLREWWSLVLRGRGYQSRRAGRRCRRGDSELAQPVEGQDGVVRRPERAVEAVEGDERVAGREEERAREAEPGRSPVVSRAPD